MASQTAIRWPLPSTGSLSGCILPAAALNHLEVPFKTEPVCPLLARRFGQRGRHAEACLTAAFDPWSSSFLSASNETPVSAHKQPQRASSLRKVVLHPADTSCRGKRRQSGLRAASNVAVSGDRGQESRIEEGSQKKRIAVFVSGGGSNYKAIQAAIDAGKVNGEVVAVISDKPGCKATEFASERGVDVSAYPKSAKFAPEGLSAEDLVQLLREKQVDIVLLAGFLKLLPAELVKAFPRAILNIHPALLPAFGGKGFYGLRVHSAVIKSGAWFSGPTVHFIDENYDAGVIVAQRIVRVLPTDTPEELQARVLKEEHFLYPIVVSALCDGRIRWREDGVPILEDPTHSSPTELPDTSSCRNVQAII